MPGIGQAAGTPRKETAAAGYTRQAPGTPENLTNQLMHMFVNEKTGKNTLGDAFFPQTMELSAQQADADVNASTWVSGVRTAQDSTTSSRSSLGAQIPPAEVFVEGVLEPITGDSGGGVSSRLEREALSHVRRLQSVPVSYLEVDRFLCSVESFARRFNKEDQLLEIAEGQMDGTVRYFYRKRMQMLLPGRQRDYQTLVEVMLRLLCLGNPEAFLRRELRGAPPHKALKLYVELGLLYDAYTRLCERTNTEIKRTEESLAQEFLSRLPNRLAEQTRRVVRTVPSPNLFVYAVVARTVDSHMNGNW
ncbi:uncharacterized protein EMH_0026790 [Eimeria mitis]|uniref:Uncharacterized protein n=1 Tax=Eimeria mitis TaxID=44415 RepID=U6KJA4_9EIME|nr:uncharacterized protein EMH_0026790 [Eimeria mitis]CDJ35543.1 hypothetical protein, conserved [Eimeria mitis]